MAAKPGQRHRRQGRPPELTARAVVDAALRVADAEGLDAVSMRRVAGELGVAVTTVYNHVASKSDLMNRLRDHVLHAFEVQPREDADWQEQIYEAFVGINETFRTHPSGIELTLTAPAIFAPNTRRIADGLVAILRRGGFSEQRAIDAVSTLNVYVSGMANHEHVQLRRSRELRRAVEAGADPGSDAVRHGIAWAEQIPADTFAIGLRSLIEALSVNAAQR